MSKLVMTDTSGLTVDQIYNKFSDAKLEVLNMRSTQFLFGLLCRLEFKIRRKVGFVAATDGMSIWVNPDYLFNLTLKEQAFVLTHEVLHVALHHVTRKGDRDHRIFNIACDYHINGTLQDLGFSLIPDIYVDQKRFKDMSAEDIYKIIFEEEQNEPSSGSSMDGDIDPSNTDSNNGSSDKGDKPEEGQGGGDPSSGEGKPEQLTPEQIQEKIDQILNSVATQVELSGGAGTIPADIARYLTELRKPKVQWKPLLQRYLLDVCKTDYSRKRVNRRYLSGDFSMPTLHGELLAAVDFAIDVSGSINDTQFRQFISEAGNVFKACRPKKINIMQFDHRLSGYDTVRNLREVQAVKFKGGGGTSPNCALKRADTSDGKVLVVFTDGYFCNEVLHEPKKPVIWIVYDNDNFKAPFGRVIKYKLEK